MTARRLLGPPPPAGMIKWVLGLVLLMSPLLAAPELVGAADSFDFTVKTDQAKTFNYGSIKIKYFEAGRGEPILFVHGYGGSSYQWRYLFEPLARNFRTVAVDLKGFGLSDKPEDGRYSPQEQAEILAALVKRLDLKGLTLAGNSIGGGVALMTHFLLAAESADWVKRLILIDTVAYDVKLPTFFKVMRTPVLNKICLATTPAYTRVETTFKHAYFDPKKIDRVAIKTYAAYMNSPGADHALLKTAEQLLPRDIEAVSDKLKAIAIPVLILWGREDKLVPLNMGRRLARDIPRASLAVIPECGHAPQEEKPAETLEIIQRFLKDGAVPQLYAAVPAASDFNLSGLDDRGPGASRN